MTPLIAIRDSHPMAKEFHTKEGVALADIRLRQSDILHDSDDPEKADYLVGVAWRNTVPINEAKTFSGIFANQHVVCKLTHPATLDFLADSFGTQ